MSMLRAKTVFGDGKVTVTAIEALELQAGTEHPGRYVTGILRPIAVVVKEPGRSRAFDMAGQPVDIQGLDLPTGLDLE